MKSQFISFTLLVFSGILFAQTNDPILMTINGKPVLKSEFEYIYNKNNSNNSLDKKRLKSMLTCLSILSSKLKRLKLRE